jgi:hypothetical protein
MKRLFGISLLLMAGFIAVSSGIADAQHSLGGGIHYLRNLGDITDDGANDFSQDSFSLIGSYQYSARILKIEGDVEYIFDYVGSGEEMWEPSAWGLIGIGRLLYGGAGIGIGYTNNEWQQNPFYALRAGVNFALSGLNLDVFTTYRFQSDQQLKDLTGEDLDSLTFAALLRFNL